MAEWVWVPEQVAIAGHADQLARHGGGSGTRDLGGLKSALARPQNLAAYGQPDIAGLAAAYAFGIARNHPFIDGNKRTAAVVSFTFVRRNGWRVVATEAEIVVAFLALAAGELSEDEMAAWFRSHLVES